MDERYLNRVGYSCRCRNSKACATLATAGEAFNSNDRI